MENNRPKLKIERSITEKLLQGITLLVFIAVTIYLVVNWSRIPDTIPKHFGVDGQPNEWGGRGGLVFLPIVILVLAFLITILERFPWALNYIVEITEKNAPFQYRNARTLLTWIKTELTLVFSYIEWKSIGISLGKADQLGLIFLPVFLVMVFGTLGIYIYRMVKESESKG